MPKDKLAGKKTGLIEQSGLAGTLEKRERSVYSLWKKQQGTQEDCKDVMKLCREKSQKGQSPSRI